jgi:glycosyltransferase involved in cell wall biosynthesis
MKIHGLCLVKNEADVLQETLVSALRWCDHIYVFDNGSDDGTWELVNELAKQHVQIVPYKQDDVLYSNGLLADIFNAFRSNAGLRDWWCRLDADEIYIDDPRIFLAKVPDRFRTVWSASFAYYFTDQDAILYRQDPARYLKIPVEQRLRHYLNHWGELRFFRHSDDMVWNRDDGHFPKWVWEGLAYPVRIWLKHYQYRSPEQIQRRLLTRRPAIEARSGFRHESLANWGAAVAVARHTPAHLQGADMEARPEFAGARWEERIVPAASLNYDGFDRRYVVNESAMPQIPPPPARPRLKAVIPAPIRTPLGRLLRQTLLLLERLQPSR